MKCPIIRTMERSQTRIQYEKKIYLAQDYICAHLDQELNLNNLAQIAAFSPFYFHRIFKSIVGETPYDFIQRIRLEKACSMLSLNRYMKITTIALDCGFSNSSSFSKAFRLAYQMSPSQYRKNGTPIGKEGKDSPPPVGYPRRELENLAKRRKEMNVQITQLPPCRIAYMRQIGPYGEANYRLMAKLKRWAITRDLLKKNSTIMGIAQDDPEVTPPEKCRYDVCLVIPQDYPLEPDLNEGQLPGGKYGVITVGHTPQAIGKAWQDIFTSWLPESGYQIDHRPAFERYSNQAGNSMGPEFCEICIPIKPLQ